MTESGMNIVEKFLKAFNARKGQSVATSNLMESLTSLFDDLAKEFNATIAHEPLMLSVQRMEETSRERDTVGGVKSRLPFERLLVSTSFWTLSIRAAAGAIEFFILPACELPNLEAGELASRAKLRLTLVNENTWCMDDLPVSESELNTLSRSLLKDLIVRSQGDYELLPESTRLVHGGLSLTRSVRSLVAERHALMQKIVNQQESILSQVARDLHDAVLGNLMLIERSLRSNDVPKDILIQQLAEISSSLRGVCHDIYPRDLKDLGLTTLLEEMCHSFQAKTGAKAKLHCQGELPDLADEVLLHVYRITQECFNNVGKHAGAELVEIWLDTADGVFRLKVKDNGRGFDFDAVGDKAGGTSIIRERSELINCMYPAKISFESSSKGTTIELEIRYAEDPELGSSAYPD